MNTGNKVSEILNDIGDEDYTRTADAKALAFFYNSRGFEKVVLEKNAVTGDDMDLRIELEAVNAHFHTTLERRHLGNKVAAFIRKWSWKIRCKLFRPMFYEQNEINGHIVASLNELNRMRGEVEMELSNLRNCVAKFNTQNQYLAERINRLQELADYLDIPMSSGLTDVEYEQFENNFRGSTEKIKERMKMYVPYFKDASDLVLDIGCGRGEFLELMRENDIKSKGVDIFEPFVSRCKDNGLDVVSGNGLGFLAGAKDDSLGGIFAAHVIEHVASQDLVLLCKNALRVVKKGGYVIFETPNPMCLSIYTDAFYIDPSHRRPVHPLYIEYIMRMVGFEDVKIVYIDKSRAGDGIPEIKGEGIENLDEVNEAIKKMSDKIYGCQDFAVVARK